VCLQYTVRLVCEWPSYRLIRRPVTGFVVRRSIGNTLPVLMSVLQLRTLMKILVIDLFFRFTAWTFSGTFIWCCPSWAVMCTVCSEVHTKHTNTLCGQSFAFVRVKPGGTYSNHWAVTTDTAISLQSQFLIATITDSSLFCCSTSSRKLQLISTPQSPQLEHLWRLPELKVRICNNLCEWRGEKEATSSVIFIVFFSTV
jgi:hypothetical protein